MEEAIKIIEAEMNRIYDSCPKYEEDSAKYAEMMDKFDVYYEIINLLRKAGGI